MRGGGHRTSQTVVPNVANAVGIVITGGALQHGEQTACWEGQAERHASTVMATGDDLPPSPFPHVEQLVTGKPNCPVKVDYIRRAGSPATACASRATAPQRSTVEGDIWMICVGCWEERHALIGNSQSLHCGPGRFDAILTLTPLTTPSEPLYSTVNNWDVTGTATRHGAGPTAVSVTPTTQLRDPLAAIATGIPFPDRC